MPEESFKRAEESYEYCSPAERESERSVGDLWFQWVCFIISADFAVGVSHHASLMTLMKDFSRETPALFQSLVSCLLKQS